MSDFMARLTVFVMLVATLGWFVVGVGKVYELLRARRNAEALAARFLADQAERWKSPLGDGARSIATLVVNPELWKSVPPAERASALEALRKLGNEPHYATVEDLLGPTVEETEL